MTARGTREDRDADDLDVEEALALVNDGNGFDRGPARVPAAAPAEGHEGRRSRAHDTPHRATPWPEARPSPPGPDAPPEPAVPPCR